jgi:hypothetical protein
MGLRGLPVFRCSERGRLKETDCFRFARLFPSVPRYPEDRSSRSLRQVGTFPPVCGTSYSVRRTPSIYGVFPHQRATHPPWRRSSVGRKARATCLTNTAALSRCCRGLCCRFIPLLRLFPMFSPEKQKALCSPCLAAGRASGLLITTGKTNIVFGVPKNLKQKLTSKLNVGVRTYRRCSILLYYLARFKE